MELREEHTLIRIIQREAETALRRNISQLLIEGLIPVKLVHVLIHVDLRVTAFPRTEVLQPRPEILRIHMSRLLENLTQLCGTLRFG